MDALLALQELAKTLVAYPRVELFILFGCMAAFPLLVLLILSARDHLRVPRKKAAWGS
jgi:hypothetical protein